MAAAAHRHATCGRRCGRPPSDPTRLTDAEALACCTPTAPALDALCRIADDLRRDGGRRRRHLRRHPEHQLHQRLLHRLPVLRLRPAPHRRRRVHAVPGPGRRPGRAGLGRPARPRSACRAASTRTCRARAYFDIARAVKERVPDMHVHAFSPDGGRQRRHPHRPVDPGLADRGQGGRAWTRSPARRPRSSTTRSAGCSPRASCPTSEWVEVVTTAHELGIPSTSTMMYGHVDHPRALARAPQADPAASRRRPAASPSSCRCRSSTPTRRSTWRASPGPGPTARENRAVHALARLLLHAAIPNIQARWVKLGDDGCRADAPGRRQRPRRHADGGDDLPDGGLGERLVQDDQRAARHGRADRHGRSRQRTTEYGVPERGAGGRRGGERRRVPERAAPCLPLERL